jgi:hypothetical protein
MVRGTAAGAVCGGLRSPEIAGPLAQGRLVRGVGLRVGVLARHQPPHCGRQALAAHLFDNLGRCVRRPGGITASALARLRDQVPGVGLAAEGELGDLLRIIQMSPYGCRLRPWSSKPCARWTDLSCEMRFAVRFGRA